MNRDPLNRTEIRARLEAYLRARKQHEGIRQDGEIQSLFVAGDDTAAAVLISERYPAGHWSNVYASAEALISAMFKMAPVKVDPAALFGNLKVFAELLELAKQV